LGRWGQLILNAISKPQSQNGFSMITTNANKKQLNSEVGRVFSDSLIRQCVYVQQPKAPPRAMILRTMSAHLEKVAKQFTAKAWVSVLEARNLVFRLQPNHANIGKRLTKLSFMAPIRCKTEPRQRSCRGFAFLNKVGENSFL
jgi:hypothetical protein